jgi:hypothetical protein
MRPARPLSFSIKQRHQGATMDVPQSLDLCHTPAHQSTFTVYRTPSSCDAADTADALTRHASLLNFLPPAKVVQSRPGVYGVCVTYAPCDTPSDAMASRAALSRVLSRILLARLDRNPLAAPPIRTSRLPAFGTARASLGGWYARASN